MERDSVILENQKPWVLPLDLQAELNLKSESMSIVYRKWLVAKGMRWGTA